MSPAPAVTQPAVASTAGTTWAQVVGPAKRDHRTKDLTARLRPGDIAIIDHEDLDQVAAVALVECRVAAVLNAASSITGRYPNTGPQTLLNAGIPLVDQLGQEIFTELNDGDIVRLVNAEVYRDEQVIATGVRQTPEDIAVAMDHARAQLAVHLEAFVANTMDYLQRERALLLDGVGVPAIRTVMSGRPVLIVVRGYHHKEDLATLRPFIRENKPILVGVDGGADALIEGGYTPDLIVGDMDSVSDKALRCGAELVVHAYRDGTAPGLDRVHELGLQAVVFPVTGTSEDAAMLLADDRGANVLVAVGTHNTLEEFLDKGRSGMASTWITRLRVGSKLVDAKGVSRLYRQQVSVRQLVMLLLAGLVAVGVALAATPNGRLLYGLVGAWFDNVWSAITGYFTHPAPSAQGTVVTWAEQQGVS